MNIIVHKDMEEDAYSMLIKPNILHMDIQDKIKELIGDLPRVVSVSYKTGINYIWVDGSIRLTIQL